MERSYLKMNQSAKLKFLIQRLSMAADAMDFEIDDKYKVIKTLPRTTKQCAEIIRGLIKRVTDNDICNNDCKGMYRCEQLKNHSGDHSEDGLTWSRDT